MKATKLLLSSLVLAGMFSACAYEEQFEVVNPEATLSERTQVNLTMSTPAETRLGVFGEKLDFSTTDQLGAVIVDGTSLFNVDGNAIGNNKWSYNQETRLFETDGTTSVGSWLFYAQYNNAVTTSRDGVTFKFPQIQEGAADLSWAANNNINFHISPIVKIDGYEGESVNVPNKYASVYNYLNIKLALPAGVTNVEKIVVSATDQSDNQVKFPAVSKVKLDGNYPVAKMAINNASHLAKIDDHDADGEPTYEDQIIEAEIAYAKLSDITRTYDAVNGVFNDPVYNWNPATSKAGAYTEKATGSALYDYLVVDCDAAHTTLSVVDGKFSTYMLMPAGIYNTITLNIYTNKGVYTKVVTGVDFYKENTTPAGTPSTTGGIILLPNGNQNLANVQKVKDVANYEYLKIDGAPAAGDLITQTSDLISFINALPETAGIYPVNILSQDAIGGNGDAEIAAHKAVVNAAVMQALANKQAKVTSGDVVLNFKQAVDIVGNTEGQLELKNLKFADANIVSGNVKIVSNVTAPSQVVTAKAGSVVEVNQAAMIAQIFVVEKGANVKVTGKNAAFDEVQVFGSFKVENVISIGTLRNNAGAVSVTKDGDLTVGYLSLGVYGVETTYGATLSNTGVITITNSDLNNSTIANNGKIYIKGLVQQWYHDIDPSTPTVTTNGSSGVVEVCGDANNASFIIHEGTTFVNKNELQTAKTAYQNTITNMGTIDVWKGATTLITNNADGADKGKIKLSERAPQFFNVSNDANKGYIVYTVSQEGTFTPDKAKDVFNTVVFEKAVTFAEAAPADYGYIANIEAYNTIDLSAITGASAFAELSFMGNGAIYTPTVGFGLKFAKMTIAEDVKVSLPAKQKLTITTELVNNGTFVVSGTATIKHGATDGDVKETGGNITWN